MDKYVIRFDNKRLGVSYAGIDGWMNEIRNNRSLSTAMYFNTVEEAREFFNKHLGWLIDPVHLSVSNPCVCEVKVKKVYDLNKED
mgnify:CR=1 FL=1